MRLGNSSTGGAGRRKRERRKEKRERELASASPCYFSSISVATTCLPDPGRNQESKKVEGKGEKGE